MGIEANTGPSDRTIEKLDSTWPLGTDLRSFWDDHARFIKAVLKTTFPGAGGNGFNTPILATEAEINQLSGVSLSSLATFVKSGIITKNMADASGTQVISGLGFTPKKISFKLSRATNAGAWSGNGSYDGITNYSIVNLLRNGTSSPPEQYMDIITSTTYCIDAYDTVYSEGQRAAVTALASDQFTLTWTKTGSPLGNAYILWEAVG